VEYGLRDAQVGEIFSDYLGRLVQPTR